MKPFHFLYAPERGGDAVKGGGHPAAEKLPKNVEISEMQGDLIGGHAKKPGINDPGVPGSKTNPGDAGSS
jgi:hypothetical protein